MTAVEGSENPGLVGSAKELIDNLGVKIVLLHGVDADGWCSCGKAKCSSIGKHPRHGDWPARATDDIGVVESWINEYPVMNIGWIPGTSLLVMDIDPRAGGWDSRQKLGRRLLPPTRNHVTGGMPVRDKRGRHLIYRKDPEVVLKSGGTVAPGIDFKTGDAALLVAPGSRTSGPYLVSSNVSGIEVAPQELLDLVAGRGSGRRTPGTSPRYERGTLLHQGGRDQGLTEYAGSLAARVRQGSIVYEEAMDAMRGRWEEVVQTQGDEITWERAQDMLQRMLDRDAAKEEDPDEAVEVEPALADGFHATDAGNSLRLLDHIAGQARWVPGWGKWLVYSEGRWVLDEGNVLVVGLAMDMVSAMFRVGIKMRKKERDPYLKWASTSEQAARLNSMVALARSDERVYTNHEELDQHPLLFNAANGTIDLSTGDLLPASPEHLITAQAPTVYDPEAQCPTWMECLERWQPDEDVRWFLKKAAGSGISGHPVQHLFVNVGPGGNGKGVFYNALAAVIGNTYYTVPHHSLITVHKQQQHETVKADLYGTRMAVASETSETDRLNEAGIKELTGGDVLSARRMHENRWSFNPSHTMFLHTNYKPVIRGGDEGIWRRVFLIPWDVIIPVAERDERLIDKLKREASGILNWLVEGCIAWQREGFVEAPEIVRAATHEYRLASDTVGQFIEWAGLRADPYERMMSSEIFALYQSWAAQNGITRPPNWQQAVVPRLEALGAVKGKTGGKTVYKGITAQSTLIP